MVGQVLWKIHNGSPQQGYTKLGNILTNDVEQSITFDWTIGNIEMSVVGI